MAGPLTIQRVPRGMLHALAMKGTGDLPGEIDPQTQLTFEASQLYLADNHRCTAPFSTANSTPGAVGFFTANATGIVPAGENWLPVQFQVGISTSAGITATIQAAYRRIDQAASFFLIGEARDVLASDIGYSFTRWRALDLVLYPGDAFGIYISRIAGGTITPTLNLDYYRLEV